MTAEQATEGAIMADWDDRDEGAMQRSEATEASQTIYDRDLTVALELQGSEPVSAIELMRAVRGLCGGLVACRVNGIKTFEVTVSHVKCKDRILDGFKIGNTKVLAKALCNDELVVSFLNLPAYISDSDIIKKIRELGGGGCLKNSAANVAGD